MSSRPTRSSTLVSMMRKGGANCHIDADPAKVYSLISDIERMGEWSPETRACEWIDGATGPEVGARFKGSNKKGWMRWSTKPKVVAADPGKEFTFVTYDLTNRREITRWSYMISSAAGGADVTETWEEVGRVRLVGGLMMNDKREAELNEGCAKTLERIKAAAEV